MSKNRNYDECAFGQGWRPLFNLAGYEGIEDMVESDQGLINFGYVLSALGLDDIHTLKHTANWALGPVYYQDFKKVMPKIALDKPASLVSYMKNGIRVEVSARRFIN